MGLRAESGFQLKETESQQEALKLHNQQSSMARGASRRLQQ